MRSHCHQFSRLPACVCLDWGQNVGFTFSHHHSSCEGAWVTLQPSSTNGNPHLSTAADIQSYLSTHPSSYPGRIFFPPLHTFLGSWRVWTMTIYQHDLWFVSRFENKMLIFQASGWLPFELKQELYSTANMSYKQDYTALQQDLFLHPVCNKTQQCSQHTGRPFHLSSSWEAPELKISLPK